MCTRGTNGVIRKSDGVAVQTVHARVFTLKFTRATYLSLICGLYSHFKCTRCKSLNHYFFSRQTEPDLTIDTHYDRLVLLAAVTRR
jgi:hypothetical protein